MQHSLEIYFLKDDITREDWQKLYTAVLQFGGIFEKFELIFKITDNIVRFVIISNKDLSALSNSLDGMLLRPVDLKEFKLPKASSKERFMNFKEGGNILDFREKLQVKRGRELDTVRFSVRTLHDKNAFVKGEFFFQGAGKVWSVHKRTFTFFPGHLFAINFAGNSHYLKKTVPTYLDIEKSMHMLLSDNLNGLFEVDTFPYFSHNYYLNITGYDFDKHSFIIGASGSGKSKLISLFVDRLQKTALNMNYRVIVIDPHASLAQDFAAIPSTKVVNFSGESAELFAGAGADISAATELTATLFKSLLADQFNARLDRLLRFSLYVLFTAQSMSLDMLKRFLTEVELRNQVLGHVQEYVPANIVRFFGGDFNEIRTQYYNESILPIVSLVDEMQLQPALVGSSEQSLAKMVNDNFLTVFSLNKVSMGEKVVKTVAGLLIQQIFLLAQANAFNQRVILIIDEVSVVQNPALAAILSEARKYNLFVFLTQQYFGQIEEDLRASILANVNNYYVFRVSEEDARALHGNLKIELPKEIIERENAAGIKEETLRVRMLTELHPRECLVRLLAKGQLNPCLKVRTLDAPTPATGAGPSVPELQPYSAPLPAKFTERAIPVIAPAPSVPVQAAPLPGTESVAAVSAVPVQAQQQPMYRAQPMPIMNLSELLAQQSTGRKKVKE